MKKEKKVVVSNWGILIAKEVPVLVDKVSASEEASPALEYFIQDIG
jgi:hypothetical protein